MSEKKKVLQPEGRTGAVIYLGPYIPGIVSSGTVFNHGLTVQLEGAVKEQPSLSMLLVPIKNVAKAKMELRKEASAMKICYDRAAEYAAQKGAKA